MKGGAKGKEEVSSSRNRQPMFIFEIPVYRVSRDQFEKETDPNGSGKAISEKMGRNEHLDSNEQFWLHYLEQVGIWRYNQMVGCICLQIAGNQARAWIFRRRGKRFSRNMRGLFEYADQIGIYNRNPYCRREDIFSDLLRELRNLKDHPALRGRHVDIECFESLGPFVDWKKLFKSV